MIEKENSYIVRRFTPKLVLSRRFNKKWRKKIKAYNKSIKKMLHEEALKGNFETDECFLEMSREWFELEDRGLSGIRAICLIGSCVVALLLALQFILSFLE